MRQLKMVARLAAGFTLIELIVTLALLALLALLAAPAFGEFLRNNKLREAGHTVMAVVQLARNEAIKRNESLAFEVSAREVIVVASDGEEVHKARLPEAVSLALLGADDAGVLPPQVWFGGAGRTVPFGSAFKLDLTLDGLPCTDTLRCLRIMVRAGGATRLCRSQVDC